VFCWGKHVKEHLAEVDVGKKDVLLKRACETACDGLFAKDTHVLVLLTLLN